MKNEVRKHTDLAISEFSAGVSSCFHPFKSRVKKKFRNLLVATHRSKDDPVHAQINELRRSNTAANEKQRWQTCPPHGYRKASNLRIQKQLCLAFRT